jgi:hypothetical protein
MAASTPTVDDLDGLLASLNSLKPPGASKTKITTITTLCVNNIQVSVQYYHCDDLVERVDAARPNRPLPAARRVNVIPGDHKLTSLLSRPSPALYSHFTEH